MTVMLLRPICSTSQYRLSTTFLASSRIRPALVEDLSPLIPYLTTPYAWETFQRNRTLGGLHLGDVCLGDIPKKLGVGRRPREVKVVFGRHLDLILVLTAPQPYLSRPSPKDQLIIRICSFFPEVMSPEEYSELVNVFPQIRQWSTYLEPRCACYEQHWQLQELKQRLADWQSIQRKLFLPFRAYRNLKLLEAPIPPSRYFAARFRRTMFLTTYITELNLQTGWDHKFQKIAAIMGRGFPYLRVLRIKHIVKSDHRDVNRMALPPWEDMYWGKMLSYFSSIEVLYINTPIKFQSWKRPSTKFRGWRNESLPNLQRIYLFHGWAKAYKIVRGDGFGDFKLFTWICGERDRPAPEQWEVKAILEEGDILPEDKDPYGPYADQVNSHPNPRREEDDENWLSDSEDESGEATDDYLAEFD
ncbi:hypothetical protein BDN72DRAFT_864727 [Pluteus cervinus]|uniref:Uncharacterized protein n=1 Tax=Pluteus cervinus TaxID=181527 RepID=A0ACD3A544_9AGAR|nr:hypothetical protein BDN72DRAFT_864727 [Pluteus cervinus]